MKLISTPAIVWTLALVIGAFFLLSNFTVAFKPKLRYNAKQSDYTMLEDVWRTKAGNKKLAIFLHGMYSNPDTFDFLADLLVENGWDVYTPALPAGAYTLEQLKQVGPWAWGESLHFAREKVLAQKGKYEQTVLGGHSQGGSLTLALAPELDFISAFLSIAGPINIYGPQLSASNNLGIFLSGVLCTFLPKGVAFPSQNTPQRQAIERIHETEQLVFPYTLFTFKHGLATVRKNLKNIKKPLFLSYEKGDQTVGFYNMPYITKHVSSQRIFELVFAIPRDIEPYGHRHDLLWYVPVQDELNAAILYFLSEL